MPHIRVGRVLSDLAPPTPQGSSFCPVLSKSSGKGPYPGPSVHSIQLAFAVA